MTAIGGSATASFSYDADNRRSSKTVSGTVTNFLYDGIQPIQELTSTNNLTAALLTVLNVDELFGRTESGATQSFLTVALGSTIRLTDSSAAKVVDVTYEAYGKSTPDATTTNSFQYTGRENDGAGLQ